jgi:hypothetical protein
MIIREIITGTAATNSGVVGSVKAGKSNAIIFMKLWVLYRLKRVDI